MVRYQILIGRAKEKRRHNVISSRPRPTERAKYLRYARRKCEAVGGCAVGAQPKTECGPAMLTELINIAVWMSYMKDVRLWLRARQHNGQSQMNEENDNGNRFNGNGIRTLRHNTHTKSLDGMCVCKRSYVTMEYHNSVCLLLRLRQSQSGANNCISTCRLCCAPPACQKFAPSLHLIHCYPHIYRNSQCGCWAGWIRAVHFLYTYVLLHTCLLAYAATCEKHFSLKFMADFCRTAISQHPQKPSGNTRR